MNYHWLSYCQTVSVSSSFTLVICFGLSGWISNKSVRSLAFGKGFLKSEKWSDLPAEYVLMRWGVSGTGSPPPVVTALQLHLLTHPQLHLLTHPLSAFKKLWEKLGWHLMAPFFCGFCIFTCLRWKPDGSEKWILAVKIFHSHTTKLERTSTIKICETKSDEISSFYWSQTYLQMLPKSSNALFSPALNQVTWLSTFHGEATVSLSGQTENVPLYMNRVISTVSLGKEKAFGHLFHISMQRSFLAFRGVESFFRNPMLNQSKCQQQPRRKV